MTERIQDRSMHHDGYADLFREAEEQSRRRSLVYRGFTTEDATAENGRALEALSVISRAVNSYPYESLDIRVQCAAIHLTLRDDRRWRSPCVLTVGDVEVDGKPEYGTTYERLDEELRGAQRNATDAYPCHVWLTFPDMHIVDVTFYIYRYYERIPSPWTWSDYLVCSHPGHAFSASLPLRYKPMLLGRQPVVRLVE